MDISPMVVTAVIAFPDQVTPSIVLIFAAPTIWALYMPVVPVVSVKVGVLVQVITVFAS